MAEAARPRTPAAERGPARGEAVGTEDLC